MRSLMPVIALMSCAPAAAQTNPDPDALARRAHYVAGSPYSVAAIQFTFAVFDEGAETVRRTHLWCPRRHVARVESAVVDLRAPADAQRHAWFINDSYWLFAPSKLLDPGVRRAMRDDLLQLTFDGVGLTSGDRYLVRIDERTGLVDGWSFELEGGRAGSYGWTDYRKVGPLWLATRRVRSDGRREIRFLDLEVLDACPL